MTVKEKARNFYLDIKWKYRGKIKNWVYKKHTEALFQPGKQFTSKFWKWLYNRLRGLFTVNTKYGEFGVNWYGFFNLDIYLGNFCRITLFSNRNAKTFLASFLRRYYKDTLFEKGKGKPYYAYTFGHELKSDYIDNKFVYYSAWHWGRCLPYVKEANIKRTGKLFGIIGWGKAKEKKPLFEFKNPPYSWITSKYVEKNGWAICFCEKDKICEGGKCEYIVNSRKVMPCFPRISLKPGDVLIFFDYDKRERFEMIDKIEIHGQNIPIIIDHGEGSEESGRYLVITEKFLEQWEQEELGCPDALVVRAPNLLGPKKENTIVKFFKKR